MRRTLNTFTDWRLASGSTPLYLLRSIFLHLQELLELQPRVIKILLANADIYPPSPVVPSWSGNVDPQLRGDFRKSIKQHLYKCNVLLSLRLRLSVAEFCWVSCSSTSLLFLIRTVSQRHTSDPSKRDEYGQVAQQFLRTISFIILRTLCRHLAAVTTCVQGN
jgi:general transcription factor 3C protein 4